MKKSHKNLRAKKITMVLFSVGILIGAVAYSNNNGKVSNFSKLDTTAVELTYKAVSPIGDTGGTALPASCESVTKVWNDNGGYHLDGITTDPGNCGGINLPPSNPVISGTVRVLKGSNVGIWDTVSKDPEGDSLYYDLDWNGDGTVDGSTRPNGALNSEVPATLGHIYNTVGTYTIRARAVEYEGSVATGWSIKDLFTRAFAAGSGKTSPGWGTYTVEVYDVINTAPEIPVISGDIWAIVNQTTSNGIVSDDVDGDQLYYELDWDGTGTVDGDTSANPTAPSVIAPIGHTYTSVGTKTVKGRAVQVNDTSKKSGWATYTIRVTNGTCTTPPNACGVTNGTVVGGQCTAVGLPAGYGNSCSGPANACGMTDNTGTINCSGSCSVTTAPSNTLCSCTSSANACGMTNNGNLNVAGICTATVPADSLCPPVGSGTTINDFSASPKLLSINRTSKLYWNVGGNRSGCRITYTTTPGGAPNPALNYLIPSNTGDLVTTPITEKRYYHLTCGAVEREAIVSPYSLTEI